MLSDADVTLYDTNNTILAKQISNPDGAFHFKLDRRDLYKLKGTRNGYYPDTANLRYKEPASYKSEKVALYLDPLFEIGKTYNWRTFFTILTKTTSDRMLH